MIKESFRRYLEEAIGSEGALVAFSAFEEPSSVAVRTNPFKKGKTPQGREVPWAEHGRILHERPLFTLDPHFHGGAYYVQDSSSMFVGHVFRTMVGKMKMPEGRSVRVLDLCAAPGGKTTDLAASLRELFGERFLLVANEVMKQRVGILADNVALWGDPNVVVTSDDPRSFAAMPGFFDVIVADVPCSGEGMFRKDEEAQLQWSEDNVALCASRQKRIVADVWPALAQDGLFIYSTCTFNRLENDCNVEWIAGELGAECLLEKDVVQHPEGVLKTGLGYGLVPGFVEGEGQYCSALRKTSEVRYAVDLKQRPARPGKTGKELQLPKGLDRLVTVEVVLRQKGDTVTAVPSTLAPLVAQLEQNLHVVAAGCALGVVKGNVLVPDADLALSLILDPEAFPFVELDRMTALSYLHRDAIILPQETDKGYVVVRYEGLPLGFVKNLGNRCNSLHPQSRRIRMNISKEIL